jgi:hypothetical protein
VRRQQQQLLAQMAASIYFSDVSVRTSGYAVEVKVPCTHSVHICGFQRGKH